MFCKVLPFALPGKKNSWSAFYIFFNFLFYTSFLVENFNTIFFGKYKRNNLHSIINVIEMKYKANVHNNKIQFLFLVFRRRKSISSFIKFSELFRHRSNHQEDDGNLYMHVCLCTLRRNG